MVLLGFGGKPRHGKDVCCSAIVKAWPGSVGVYSVSEEICKELGVKREGLHNVALLQEHSKMRYDQDTYYWARKIMVSINEDRKSISLISNVRRLAEVEYFCDNGPVRVGSRCHFVRTIRLNGNGSLYCASDRDLNHELETELDNFNWDYRLVAKTGQDALLGRWAVQLVRYLLLSEGES